MKKTFSEAVIEELDIVCTENTASIVCNGSSGPMLMSLSCGNIFTSRVKKSMMDFDDEDETFYGEED